MRTFYKFLIGLHSDLQPDSSSVIGKFVVFFVMDLKSDFSQSETDADLVKLLDSIRAVFIIVEGID